MKHSSVTPKVLVDALHLLIDGLDFVLEDVILFVLVNVLEAKPA